MEATNHIPPHVQTCANCFTAHSILCAQSDGSKICTDCGGGEFGTVALGHRVRVTSNHPAYAGVIGTVVWAGKGYGTEGAELRLNGVSGLVFIPRRYLQPAVDA